MNSTGKLITLFSVLVTLVAMVISGSYWAFDQIEKASEARRNSNKMIRNANGLLATLVDAETGQRGFLLTDDEVFLEPYFAAEGRISGQMREFRQITRDRFGMQRLDALERMVADKMAYLWNNIELGRKHDKAGALANMRGKLSKPLMDSIQVEISSVIRAEEVGLARHEAEFRTNMQRMFLIIIGISLLTLLFAIAFIYFIRREKLNQVKSMIHRETRHLLALQEDTNERLRLANDTLQQSEEKLAVTLNSIGDGVLAADVNGNVTLLNPIAEQFSGWTLDEALGRPVEEVFRIIDQDSRQSKVLPVRETLLHGTVHMLTNHTMLVSRDGSECAIADSCAPIRGKDGKVIGVVLVFRDVTRRREIENGLERAHEELKTQAVELERTARAKSEFLSNMSHELRTPLNSINGFSEVLYDETFGPLNEKQKKYVSNVLTSGKHLLLLINQILDMAKVDSGKMNLSLSNLSMKNLLREHLLLIEDITGKKKLHLQIEIDENVPDIQGDELKVKQIIYNLLSNAVKFTPEGGKIGMQAKREGGDLEIVVWDDGIGIANENMEKIFEGFFRVDTPNLWVTEGTGLGLPLSRKLVELHGGKLNVESKGLGLGTRVRFTLPITAMKEK